MLRSAIQASLLSVLDLESELSGDYHLVTKWSQRFADQLFVRVRAIHFGRVKERDTAFDGCSDQRDPLLLVYGWAIAKTQPHAPESDGRHFQIILS